MPMFWKLEQTIKKFQISFNEILIHGKNYDQMKYLGKKTGFV